MKFNFLFFLSHLLLFLIQLEALKTNNRLMFKLLNTFYERMNAKYGLNHVTYSI